MDEHNELCTRLHAVGMELFRRDGLRFTMQQAAAMMHISKRRSTQSTPPRRRCCWIWWTMRLQGSTPASSASLTAPALAEKLRAVIIALPEEYTALDLQQMDFLDENIPESQRACGSIWKPAGSLPWHCWSRQWGRVLSVGYPCRFCSG